MMCTTMCNNLTTEITRLQKHTKWHREDTGLIFFCKNLKITGEKFDKTKSSESCAQNGATINRNALTIDYRMYILEYMEMITAKIRYRK
jgi:hypothetical protein